MAVNNLQKGVSYGLSQPLLVVGMEPIISQRAPGANDKAPFGTIWIDQPNNDVYVLTSIVGNVSTWIGAGGGAGSFTNVTASGFVHAGTDMQAGTTITAGTGLVATTGGVTASAGNIVATLGDISASAGSVSAATTVTAGTGLIATTGGVTASAGDITATLGDIVSSAGSVSAATMVTAGTGITATTGNITATTGDIISSTGDVTANGDVTAVLGDITASAGFVRGEVLIASGDLGGFALSTSISNVVDTTQGAGTLSIVSASANPGTNTGFLKFYVGVTPVFVPYFVTIAP